VGNARCSRSGKSRHQIARRAAVGAEFFIGGFDGMPAIAAAMLNSRASPV
jgi:hypothetical protein